jgi:hypothetical protein
MSKRLENFFNSYSREEAVQTVSTLVKPQMYKMVMPNGEFLQEKMPEGLRTKWSKLLADVDQNSFILEHIIDAIFKQGDINEYPELYDLGISQLTPAKVSMIFGAFRTTSQHNKFVKLVQSKLNDFIVIGINGTVTTNRKAEEKVKKAVGKAKREGKRVVIISKDMASRSFSVSEIDTVFLMYDNGLLAQTIQKVSRAFTPGKTYMDEQKTTGTIISLSFDDNRSELDPVDQYVIAEASRTGKEHESLQESIKRVSRSFNIFAQSNGQPASIDSDEYAEQLISSTSLTKIAGAGTKFHMLDIQACLDGNVLLSSRKNSTEKHKASVSIIGVKTYIKTDSESTRGERDQDSKEAKELMQTVAYFAQNIGELSAYNDFGCETALCTIDSIIESGEPLISEVEAFFGLDINFMKSLLEEGIISRKISNTIINGRNRNVQVLEPMW